MRTRTLGAFTLNDSSTANCANWP